MLTSVPKNYTASQLVFNEPFSGSILDSRYWNTFMTSNSTQGGAWDSDGNGGSGVGGPLDADYFEPNKVAVNKGLTLNAVQQSVLGANWLNGQVTPQMFPVASSVVDTYGKTEFNGGYLQISMKQPSGDGSWPSLWLLPGSHAGSVGNNFEIDIQEGGYYTGSANPNDVFSYHLHTPSGTFGGSVDTGVDLTAAFHTFAIDWKPGQSISWLLDGAVIATITSAQAPIPNEPMELIMSNQVATSAASSWRTSLNGSSPQSMPMQVDGVQLYQSPGWGETVFGSNVVPAATSPRVTILSSGGSAAQPRRTISGVVDAANAGAVVSLFDGTDRIGSVVADANGHWSATVTLTRQGANIVTASATNAAGIGVSAPVTFVLHSSAPSVSISTSGKTTSQAKQSLSGMIDAADAGSKVSIFDGNRLIGSTVSGADGHWSADVTLTHTGANSIIATAQNVAGFGSSRAVQFVLNQPAASPSVIQNSAGSQIYNLDNRSYMITLGGYNNSVTAGDGNNVVSPGAGNETVKLGNGANRVTLSGYGNSITIGDGADSVMGGSGDNSLQLGNGAGTIWLGGFNNSVKVGDGAHSINAGAGNETITAGNGSNTIKLNGYYNTVSLGAGKNVIEGGQGHDEINLSGGSATLNLNGDAEHVTLANGVSAKIFDFGAGARFDIGSSAGDDVITGLAQDSSAIITLLNHAGGFSSAMDILDSLRSDGNGGSLLTLGAQGSLDIIGVAPSHLTAANFTVA